jgi:CheY-like chemotaxis protein
MDLGLRKVDGWTLIRSLDADPSTVDIPIRVCSAHAMVEER